MMQTKKVKLRKLINDQESILALKCPEGKDSCLLKHEEFMVIDAALRLLREQKKLLGMITGE